MKTKRTRKPVSTSETAAKLADARGRLRQAARDFANDESEWNQGVLKLAACRFAHWKNALKKAKKREARHERRKVEGMGLALGGGDGGARLRSRPRAARHR
jgi:hypothetical protein